MESAFGGKGGALGRGSEAGSYSDEPPGKQYGLRSLRGRKSIMTLGQYGAVLVTQGLASSPLAPVNEALLSANGDVEFKWKAVRQCAHAGKDQYSLRIYGSDLTAPVFSSPFTHATDLIVTAAQVKTLAGANGRLFWAVVSRDDTEPATGEFHGPLSAINLKLD